MNESAESAVSVDGIQLAEFVANAPLSRGSIFELIKALGISTKKGPGPGGKGRVAWLSADDADRLDLAAQAVNAGKTKIADYSTGLQRLATPPTPPTDSAESAESADPAPFLARLDAAERAVRSGLGLTTAEASWILGVRPGSTPLIRGGLTITRTGWNCWLITKNKQ